MNGDEVCTQHLGLAISCAQIQDIKANTERIEESISALRKELREVLDSHQEQISYNKTGIALMADRIKTDRKVMATGMAILAALIIPLLLHMIKTYFGGK